MQLGRGPPPHHEIGADPAEIARMALGTPDSGRERAEEWRGLSATHLAIGTQRAGHTDAAGQLERVAECVDALCSS